MQSLGHVLLVVPTPAPMLHMVPLWGPWCAGSCAHRSCFGWSRTFPHVVPNLATSGQVPYSVLGPRPAGVCVVCNTHPHTWTDSGLSTQFLPPANACTCWSQSTMMQLKASHMIIGQVQQTFVLKLRHYPALVFATNNIS